MRKHGPPSFGAMSDGSTPVFLQGRFAFEGKGLDGRLLVDESLRYVVPAGTTTQPVYFRGGNSTGDMISVVLFCGGSRCATTESCCPTFSEFARIPCAATTTARFS